MATINKNLTQTARDLGVSLGALLKANPHLRDPDNIRAGTQLNVPRKRKLSARDNAKQMARIFSISSTGVKGDPTNADVARSEDRFAGYGGSVQGGGAGAVTLESGASLFDPTGKTLTGAAFDSGLPETNPELKQLGVTIDTQFGVDQGDRRVQSGPAADDDRFRSIRAPGGGNIPKDSKAARNTRFDQPLSDILASGRNAFDKLLGLGNNPITKAGIQFYSNIYDFASQAVAFPGAVVDDFRQQELRGIAESGGEIPQTPAGALVTQANDAVQDFIGSLGEALDSDLLRNLEDTLGNRNLPFRGTTASSVSPNVPSSASLTTTSANDNPVVTRELIVAADGTRTWKLWRKDEWEKKMSTPQEVVISRSFDGSRLDPDNPAKRGYHDGVLGLTKGDIAYTANYTGKALLEFRRQSDPSIRPNMVATESAAALIGMANTLTGLDKEDWTQGEMMTELGYVLVGDFWIIDPSFVGAGGSGIASFYGNNAGLTAAQASDGRGGGGGGTGRGSASGGGTNPGAWNWHVGITV